MNPRSLNLYRHLMCYMSRCSFHRYRKSWERFVRKIQVNHAKAHIRVIEPNICVGACQPLSESSSFPRDAAVLPNLLWLAQPFRSVCFSLCFLIALSSLSHKLQNLSRPYTQTESEHRRWLSLRVSNDYKVHCIVQIAHLTSSARITILQSCGYAIFSVHANEFAKISAHNTASYHMLDDTGGASMQILNFPVEKTLVRFLAHWIYHRDATEAMNASMNRQDEAQPGQVDEEWLIFLLRAMNFCGNRANFTCDITDSLVDAFLLFIASKSGLVHLDQIFTICKKHCKTITLTPIFANLFLHHRK